DTCRILWDRVPSAYKEAIVFSDYWNAYQAVIPTLPAREARSARRVVRGRRRRERLAEVAKGP
ncbi:MAG: hypothetical protein, partial [Olavius algarvensis Gamma 1 endosymbiont]